MSITLNKSIVNEQSGISTSFSFSVKEKNLGMMFHILRSQLYSNPIAAIIREYCANAKDANVAAKSNRPIQITLPTELNSFIKIRDFGNGLSDEEVKNIFCEYGESTKRDSNDFIGNLGIGSKSAFSYTDSFLIHSFQNGKLRIWNAYIDISQKGAMSKVSETDTLEPNGIEIEIPIRQDDIAKFRETVCNFFIYWDELPVIIDLTDTESLDLKAKRELTYLFAGDSWKYNPAISSQVIMGGVAYPLDMNVFNEEVSDEIKNIFHRGLLINVNIGELSFSASREALQYDKETKAKLVNKFKNIEKELRAQVGSVFKNCKTLWDAKILFEEVFNLDGKFYGLRNLFSTNLEFNGHKLNNNYFITHSKNFIAESCVYVKPGLDKKVEKRINANLTAHAQNLVVENDLAFSKGIKNYMVGLLDVKNAVRGKEKPKYQKVYLLSFGSTADKAKWMEESGFDGPLVPLSTLSKEKWCDYYPSASYYSYNEKHRVKEFIYNTDGNSKQNNSFWETQSVDLQNDEGVYVEIRNFKFLDTNFGYSEPYDLREKLYNLESIGVVLPNLYGFKHDSVTKAAQNPKMVNFWQFYRKSLKDFLDNNQHVIQEYVNHTYVKETFSDISGAFYKIARNIKNNWNNLKCDHPLYHLCEKIECLNPAIKSINPDETRRIINEMNYQHNCEPTFKLENDYNVLNKRYPLLTIMANNLTGEILSNKTLNDALNNYVFLVDAANP